MRERFQFDSAAYGNAVAEILALDGAGLRLMPLAHGECSSAKAAELIENKTAAELFPAARDPRAALSGLWLYFSCLDRSHTISQDIDSAEGSFWHGILHRQEPDAGNAGYWFRQVGRHPIFPALLEEAQRLGAAFPEAPFSPGQSWDPLQFIEFCEAVRSRPGSPGELLALHIQRAEWQLLFDYCARGAK